MIKNYAHYNVWANKILFGIILDLTLELQNQEIKSSFNSIRKTVFHIYDAETLWLERLTHKPIIDWPSSKHLPHDVSLDILVKASENLLAYVVGKNENYFLDYTTYNDTKGNPYKTRNDEIMQHVFNHSTFHRGQLVTLFRQIGLTTIPSTDFISYVRQNSN